MHLVSQLFVCAYLALRFPAESFGAAFFTEMSWQALCLLTDDYAAIFGSYEGVTE